MSTAAEKKQAKKAAKEEANLALLAQEFGRSDLTGEVHYHNGPSWTGNAFSRMGVTNVVPVVHTGAKRLVEHHDLWKLRKHHATASAWDEFEPNWKAQQASGDPSLFGAMGATYGRRFLLALLCQFVSTAAQYAYPVMMPHFITWFIYAPILPFWWVFVYVAAIFAAQVTQLLFQYHCILTCYDFGIRMRASLITMVYRKSLYTPLGRSQTSGMVVNLISTDAQIVLDTLPFFIQGILAPFQIIVTLGLLSRYIGPYCLISLAVAFVFGPMSGIFAGRLGYGMAQVMKKGDTRLKLVKEFLSAVRIVKYYAWEKPFVGNIQKARLEQVTDIKNFMFNRAYLWIVLSNIPGFSIGLTFVFYGIKNSLNFNAVFSAMVYLNMLNVPFIYFPMLMAFGAQYFTAIKRLEFFALRSELKPAEISEEDEEISEEEAPKKKKKKQSGKSKETETIEAADESDTLDQDSTPTSTETRTEKRQPGGMYIKGAAFAWETILTIAEGRYLDLEMKEQADTAAAGAAGDAAVKAKLNEVLEHTKAEKAHVGLIVRSIQKQVASGTPLHKVNIDTEEKDCVAQDVIDAQAKADAEAANGKTDTNGKAKDHVVDEQEQKNGSTKKKKSKKEENGEEKADALEDVPLTDTNGKDKATPEDGKPADAKAKGKAKKPFAKLRRPVINLQPLDFDVRKGSLTMVVGSVGSGKSTLAMAFLKEVHQRGGTVKVFEEFAYGAQEAWILNATIRDNITFGSSFDPERYADVVRACALTTDLASFPAADLTEIGERGINLSGGQKQRINVARAMYSDAPIVILDDPFSAVDSHVGEHMFEHVIMKGLREKGRTVLLITNQLHFVPNADYIGVVHRGKLVEQGTFEHLSHKESGALAKMLRKQSRREENAEESAMSLQDGDESDGSESSSLFDGPGELKASGQVSIKNSSSTIKKSADNIKASTTSLKKSSELAKSGDLKQSTISLLKDDEEEAKRREELKKLQDVRFEVTPEKDEELKRKGALILVEEREHGNIVWETYWKYLQSGTLRVFFFYLFFQACKAAIMVFNGIWLSWWSDPTNSHGFSHGTYEGGYIGLILGNTVFSAAASIAFIFFSTSSGRILHGNMLESVAKAPTAWFDRTPLGRVIARFSKDISLIDLELPSMFDNTINFTFMLLSLLAALAVGSAYVLIIIAVALIGFGALTLHYRKTSIQVQRLEALSRSPIFSHFTQTLEGAVTIRAYRMAHVFRVANMNKIDTNNVDFLGLRWCSTWFALTLDFLGAVTVALSYIAMILVRHYASNANVGYIIFAISQAGGVTQTLAGLSHMLTDTENKMNAVERVLQYSKLESEGPFEVPDNRPAANWPERGVIELDDLSVEYKQGIPVLKGVSCKIRPHEKVGIVGRTGAGKSTLITALFRTIEPVTGKIVIDGMDITKIGLTDLRSRLSIIPQTPQLFVGTVRYNLDPFEQYTDDDLWRVLKMVKLKKHVASLDGQLLSPVEENGSNFSVGQRQLLSMARCLLRETHVLLLDEATAAVDVETDALLQQMIRRNFKGVTVLTIAHRLNTIMDSDRIMVLDAGKIAEFDTPATLLKNKKGVLYGMVEATGPTTSAFLHEIAKQKAAADKIAEQETKEKTATKESKDKSSKKSKKQVEPVEEEESEE